MHFSTTTKGLTLMLTLSFFWGLAATGLRFPKKGGRDFALAKLWPHLAVQHDTVLKRYRVANPTNPDLVNLSLLLKNFPPSTP